MPRSTNRISPASPPEVSRLLAVALADEDTFWLCLPRSQLRADWRSCMAYWLYPAEEEDGSGANVREALGCAPDDSIFELATEGVSRVERFATLAESVEARRHTLGRVTYMVVSKRDIDLAQQRYDGLERREEIVGRRLVADSQGREVDEEAGAAQKERASSRTKQPSAPEGDRNGKESDGTGSDDGDDGNYVGGAEPVPPPQSAVPSSAVQEWEQVYIYHVGSAAYACNCEENPTWGFRMFKAMQQRNAVFLLYLDDSDTFTRISLRGTATLAKVHCTIPFDKGPSVMVLTRVISADELERINRRRAQAKERHHALAAAAASKKAAEQSEASGKTGKRSRETMEMEMEEEKRGTPTTRKNAPLRCANVNVWSDSDTGATAAVPSVETLASRFPYPCPAPADGGTAVSVLSDGTCVTHAGTPQKGGRNIGKGGKNEQQGKGTKMGKSGSQPTAAPNADPRDDEMKALLENIKLAKEQINEMGL